MRAEFPKVISLRLERELREALKAEAERRDTSISELVRQSVRATVQGDGNVASMLRAG